jgi:hypothetical protein
MLRIFVLVLLFFIRLTIAAQDNSIMLAAYRTDSTAFPRFHINSIGTGQQTLRDPLLSTLRYNGVALGYLFNTQKYKPKFLTNSLLSLHLNLLTNQSTGALIVDMGGSYSYGMLKKIKSFSNNNRSLYVGGMAELVYNFRLAINNTNNVYAYDGVLSSGATGIYQQRFKMFGREFMISDQLDLPLLSLVSRPPYAWSYPLFFEETGKFSDALQFGSWNKYFKVKNQIMLDFYTNVKHKRKKIGKTAWRLTYSWEYFQIPQLNKVQSGATQIYIGKIIKF